MLFPANIAKLIGTPFLKNICERLLLATETYEVINGSHKAVTSHKHTIL